MTGPFTAVDVDRILCDPQQAAEYRARLTQPTPRNDQIRAAGNEAELIHLAVIATLAHPSVSATPFRDFPEWVRLGVITALIEWARGDAATCTHHPTMSRPQPVFAAAWKPGLIVCQPCCVLFETPRGSRTDRTCDYCGNVGTDPVDPNLARVGLVTWFYGTCADCHDKRGTP